MEKSWENFWTTGKVEDYLTYRNRVTSSESEKEQERSTNGTVSNSDGNGSKYHAYF